jgi:hypothetical protein
VFLPKTTFIAPLHHEQQLIDQRRTSTQLACFQVPRRRTKSHPAISATDFIGQIV